MKPSREDYVLVVEDNPDTREALTLLLETGGYRVEGASNGLEALERLQQEPSACLILLDLMMPVMDGWEFRQMQKQRSQWKDIPTITLSALHEDDHPNGEVVAHITKPYDPNMLLEAVKRHC